MSLFKKTMALRNANYIKKQSMSTKAEVNADY